MNRLVAVYAALAYTFLYLPLFVLAAFSINVGKVAVWRGFTFDWYRAAFTDEALFESTRNSLVIAVSATILSTIAGTLLAYSLWKRRSRVLSSALFLSLLTPEIVAGVSLLAFFQGLFRYLHLQLGMHTVILAHVSFCLAYVVIVVLARLRTVDATLEEAALDLGATEWVAFRRITLPLLAPGILAAALLCFAVSFDDYVITSLVSGVNSETLPMVVYAMARKGVSPEINAVSVLITVMLGALILLAGRLERR